MNKLAEASCRDLIKFNFSKGKLSLQEVQPLSNCDIYSKQNVDILTKLNNSNHRDKKQYFYQLANEVKIEEDYQVLFKQILQQSKNLNKIIQRKLQVLQNIRIEYSAIMNDYAYVQSCEEDPKDIKIQISNQIMLDEDYKTVKDYGFKDFEFEDFSSDELLNVQFLISILSSYEDFILNKLQDLEFGMIIVNPFKIDYTNLQYIFLDKLTAFFALSTPCHVKEYTVKSNILDLFTLKQQFPNILIEIFQLFVVIVPRQQHQFKDRICTKCYSEFDNKRAYIDLNSYFSKIINLKIKITGWDLDSFMNNHKIDLNFKFEKYEQKIYSEFDLKNLLTGAYKYQSDVFQLIDKENELCFDFQRDFVKIPNLLNEDYLFTIKRYQIIIEQQDQSMLKLIIFEFLQINQFLNLNLQKLIVDLFYD